MVPAVIMVVVLAILVLVAIVVMVYKRPANDTTIQDTSIITGAGGTGGVGSHLVSVVRVELAYKQAE